MTLTVADNDPVKAKVTVFSTGQDKVCLDTFVRTQNAGSVPLQKQGFIEIPGLGRLGSIPIEVNLISRIEESHFSGVAGGGINMIDTVGQQSKCSFNPHPAVDDQAKKLPGPTAKFTFTRKDRDRFELALDSSVEVISTTTPPFIRGADGKLTKSTTPAQTTFSSDDLKTVVYRINGYGVTNVAPSVDENVACTFQTISPQTQRNTLPAEQQWTLHTELYYPDENQMCGDGSSPAAPVSRTAFETKKQIPLKVRDTKTETALVAAYQRGKQALKNRIVLNNQEEFQGRILGLNHSV